MVIMNFKFKNMPWYKGLTLIENLEKIDIIENQTSIKNGGSACNKA